MLGGESLIKQRIKNYSITTLSDSVKKYYNGDCARINIDKADNLDEVINLLKDIHK